MDMLKNLPPGYQFELEETKMGSMLKVPPFVDAIQFTIDSKLVKSELLDKKIDKFRFDLLFDKKFPFQQPLIFCRTEVTQWIKGPLVHVASSD